MARKTSQKTEREPRATDDVESFGTPKAGETYRCQQCGMEMKVIVDCECEDPDMVHFECCGQELVRE